MTTPITPLPSIHIDPTAAEEAAAQLQATLTFLEQILGQLANTILLGVVNAILRALGLGAFTGPIDGLLSNFETQFESFVANPIGTITGDISSLIGDVGGTVIGDVATAINESRTDLSTLITDVGSGNISGVVSVINLAADQLAALISGVSGAVIGDVVTAINTALTNANAILDGIASALGVGDAIPYINAFFSDAHIVVTDIDALISAVGSSWGDVITLIEKIQKIIDGVIGALNPLGVTTGNPVTAIETTIQSSLSGVLPSITGNGDGTGALVGGIVDNLDGTATLVTDSVHSLVDNLDGTATSVAHTLQQAAVTAGSTAAGSLTAAVSNVQGVADHLVSAIEGTVSTNNPLQEIGQAIYGFFGGLQGAFQGSTGSYIPPPTAPIPPTPIPPFSVVTAAQGVYASTAINSSQIGGLTGLTVDSLNQALRLGSVGMGGGAGGTYVAVDFGSYTSGAITVAPTAGPGFGLSSASYSATGGGNPFFPAPVTEDYLGAGTWSYSIPAWANHFDLIVVGAGGGGGADLLSGGNHYGGAGGAAGAWNVITLTRAQMTNNGANTSVTVVVGAPGAPGVYPAGSGGAGGTTSIIVPGTGSISGTGGGGGGGAAVFNSYGVGASPGNETYDGVTYTGGAAQGIAEGAGNGPGGGGAGAYSASYGGYGGPGGAFIVAYYTPPPSSVNQIDIASGTAAEWSSGVGYEFAYLPTATTTDYQVVSMQLGGLNNIGSGDPVADTVENLLIGRSNNTMGTCVVAYILDNTAYLGCFVGGAWTLFDSFAHTPIAGALYELVCGDSASSSPYVLEFLCNGAEIIGVTDSSHISQVGSSYRYGGLGMLAFQAGYFPANVTQWGIADNAPPPITGSITRLFLSSNVSLTSGAGAAVTVPTAGLYDVVEWQSLDQQLSGTSADTITITVAGVYIVKLQYWFASFFNGGTTSFFGPVLYKNGSVFEYGQVTFDGQGASATFIVECAAGDYLTPGYFSNIAVTIAGDGAGTLTFFSVALANCGTLS